MVTVYNSSAYPFMFYFSSITNLKNCWNRITEGRYKNVSEVIRDELCLIEEHEMILNTLKNVIQ